MVIFPALPPLSGVSFLQETIEKKGLPSIQGMKILVSAVDFGRNFELIWVETELKNVGLSDIPEPRVSFGNFGAVNPVGGRWPPPCGGFMKISNSIQFATAKRTEDDVLIDLYCEVLMAYMLVESALGECDLRIELGAALDSGERERLESAWSIYQNLPNEIKEQILRGDAGFEQSILEEDDERIPEVAGKKPDRKSA